VSSSVQPWSQCLLTTAPSLQVSSSSSLPTAQRESPSPMSTHGCPAGAHAAHSKHAATAGRTPKRRVRPAPGARLRVGVGVGVGVGVPGASRCATSRVCRIRVGASRALPRRRRTRGRAGLTRPLWRANASAMSPLAPVVVCCALAVISALGVVLLKRPVHVAVGLLGHSLSMAALYFSVNAQMMAVAQTLIYSGAIVVLFLIVVALLPTGGREDLGATRFVSAAAVLGAIGAGLVVMLMAAGSVGEMHGTAPTVKDVGKPLFTSLIVPFELTAPLLLAAIVSAIALWKRQEKMAKDARGGAR
jgi:NADH-quinone oxidoreductase subunit J